MAQLPAPQRIGSTQIRGLTTEPDEIPIIPMRRFGPSPAPSVFDSVESYLTALLNFHMSTKLLVGEEPELISQAEKVIGKLKNTIDSACAKVLPASPSRRCVLAHDDLRMQNIMVSVEKGLTGLIDWEYHSCRPSLFFIGYPEWISYQGSSDPRFASENTVWLEGPAGGGRLRSIFESRLKSHQSSELSKAFVEGAFTRDAVSWMQGDGTLPDFGCQRLAAWLDSEH